MAALGFPWWPHRFGRFRRACGRRATIRRGAGGGAAGDPRGNRSGNRRGSIDTCGPLDNATGLAAQIFHMVFRLSGPPQGRSEDRRERNHRLSLALAPSGPAGRPRGKTGAAPADPGYLVRISITTIWRIWKRDWEIAGFEYSPLTPTIIAPAKWAVRPTPADLPGGIPGPRANVTVTTAGPDCPTSRRITRYPLAFTCAMVGYLGLAETVTGLHAQAP